MMKTSLFRIDVSATHQQAIETAVGWSIRMVTDVSPFLNLLSVAEPGFMPSRSHTPSASLGCDDPLKTMAPRMVGGPRRVTSL